MHNTLSNKYISNKYIISR